MPLSRPSVVAGVLLIVIAAPLWISLDFFEERELGAARERIQADTQSAASKLERFLSDRLHTLRMVSNILEPATLNEEGFVKAAADFNLALPGLKAINWIALDGTITWIFPKSGNEAALTPPLELFQGSWGVACYFPVLYRSPTEEA